jgi:hypothetical protein
LENLAQFCGRRWYVAMDDEYFVKDLRAIVLRSQQNQHKEAGALLLRLIRAWGETLLPYRSNFEHIVGLYLDLQDRRLQAPGNAPINVIRSEQKESTGSEIDGSAVAQALSNLADSLSADTNILEEVLFGTNSLTTISDNHFVEKILSQLKLSLENLDAAIEQAMYFPKVSTTSAIANAASIHSFLCNLLRFLQS